MGRGDDLPVPSWSMKVKMKLSLDRRQRSGTDTFLPTRQPACKAHEHSLMSVALTHGCTLDEAAKRLQEEHPLTYLVTSRPCSVSKVTLTSTVTLLSLHSRTGSTYGTRHINKNALCQYHHTTRTCPAICPVSAARSSPAHDPAP